MSYPKFTRQETFDIVSNHLLKQGKKAMDRTHTCVYFGEDGLRCAAGVLVPDEDYTKQMEAKSVITLSGKNNWFGHSLDLVYKLQLIHDTANPLDWGQRLRALAGKLKLKYKG